MQNIAYHYANAHKQQINCTTLEFIKELWINENKYSLSNLHAKNIDKFLALASNTNTLSAKEIALFYGRHGDNNYLINKICNNPKNICMIIQY